MQVIRILFVFVFAVAAGVLAPVVCVFLARRSLAGVVAVIVNADVAIAHDGKLSSNDFGFNSSFLVQIKPNLIPKNNFRAFVAGIVVVVRHLLGVVAVILKADLVFSVFPDLNGCRCFITMPCVNCDVWRA